MWKYAAVSALLAAGMFAGYLGAEPHSNSAAAKSSLEESAAPREVQHNGQHDGQHDFDFEFGTWKTHLKRLQHPLTGSTTWVEYDGTSVVRKIWNGRENSSNLRSPAPPDTSKYFFPPLQSPIPPVEPQLLQQQRRHDEPTNDRRVQKRARRVFRSGRF